VWASQRRDEVVRSNTLRRDYSEQASKTVRSGLTEGDDASLHGERVHIVELLITTPSGPSKALVRHLSGKSDVVNYHYLKPLADPTSELMLPREVPVSPGDFVFFDAPDSFIHGGIVRGPTSPDGTIPVHALVDVILLVLEPVYRILRSEL